MGSYSSVPPISPSKTSLCLLLRPLDHEETGQGTGSQDIDLRRSPHLRRRPPSSCNCLCLAHSNATRFCLNGSNRPRRYNLDISISSSAPPVLLIRTLPGSMSRERGTPLLKRMALHAAPQVQVKHTLNNAVVHEENNRSCFRNSRHDGVFHGRRCPLFGATLLLTFINSLVCGGHDPDDKSGSRRILRISRARGNIAVL